jgi:hypothetical protein
MVDGAMPGLYGQYATRNLCQKDAILTLLLQFDSLLLGRFAKQQFNMQEALCLLSQSDEARAGERMMNAVTPFHLYPFLYMSLPRGMRNQVFIFLASRGWDSK